MRSVLTLRSPREIALMRKEDYPTSREQCDWFYRRSGMVMRSPFMLNSGWLEPWRPGLFPAASYVAEAGKDFGITGDELRLELGRMQPPVIADRDLAAAVALQQGGKAPPDGPCVVRPQRFADDAANVVFAQAGRVELVLERAHQGLPRLM